MEYIILIGWIFCTIVSAGIVLADFCSIGAEYGEEFHNRFLDYRYKSHLRFAWAISLFGPITLIVSLIYTGFGKSGWMNPFKFKFEGLK